MNQRRYALVCERRLLPFEATSWAVDENQSPSRQVELIGEAFLALNLVKLLQKYNEQSFPRELVASKQLIDRGIDLVQDVQRGGNYLAESGQCLTEAGQYLIQRPESVGIARQIEAHGNLSVSETCEEVVRVLQNLQRQGESVPVPTSTQIGLARKLFVEIHKGILDELEDLKSRTL